MVNWNSKYFWPVVLSVLAMVSGAMLTLAQQHRGEWQLQASRLDDSVHLIIREAGPERWRSNGFDVPVGELRGLSGGMLFQSGPVKFELVRDAGRFLLEGAIRNGSGSGDFTFEPNPNFGRDLSALG